MSADPFAPPPGTKTKYAGSGKLKGPRVTTPKQVGTGGPLVPVGVARNGGGLSFSKPPNVFIQVYAQFDLPERTYAATDVFFIAGDNRTAQYWSPYSNRRVEILWNGADSDFDSGTRYPMPRPIDLGEDAATQAGWGSAGTALHQAIGEVDPLRAQGDYQRYVPGDPAGLTRYGLVVFQTAYTLNPRLYPEAMPFAYSDFGAEIEAVWLGAGPPSWSWTGGPDTWQPWDHAFDGLGHSWAPAAGCARIIVAFTDTGPDNYLAGPTYQDWAVEFADQYVVILSRPVAAEMAITLPAAAGPNCTRIVTALWLPPATCGGAGTRPVGKLRGRHTGKRIGFDPKKRNPFA